jgi:hypothetical protein
VKNYLQVLTQATPGNYQKAYASQYSRNGTEHMKYALSTLMLRSLWLFSFNLTLAQALVLASVYFAYIIRPLHSWRLIYLATNLLQLDLSN